MKLLAHSLIMSLLFINEVYTLTFVECAAACASGTLAMQRFCTLIPHPAIRAGCWGVSSALSTPAGRTACTNWCAWWFTENLLLMEMALASDRNGAKCAPDWLLDQMNATGQSYAEHVRPERSTVNFVPDNKSRGTTVDKGKGLQTLHLRQSTASTHNMAVHRGMGDSPWIPAQSIMLPDGSVSLLCICPNAAGATQTTLPWRSVNTIDATSVYMKQGLRQDAATGGQVIYTAGVASGGVRLAGVSDDGPAELTCAAGCIAWWSHGALLTGRDDNLMVNIPPPGGLFGRVTGPNGGVRSEGSLLTCISGDIKETRCTAGNRKCVFAGGPCIILTSVGHGTPEYSFTAACAAAFASDESQGSGPLAQCTGGSLAIGDLVQVSEASQVYI